MKAGAGMTLGELAAFYHWNDRQCLQQAVWVAQERPIDWEALGRWSRQERAVETFAESRRKCKGA